jgi:hypothetical protein
MVRLLRVRAPIRADQTFTSYVGQLSRMNLQHATDDFCRDMGTTLQLVAAGDRTAIEKIAAVSGADPAEIEGAAFKRNGRSLVFRGQTLTHQVRTPQHIRFCPECLQDDIARAAAEGARRPHHHVYGRPQWYATQYRTCVRHGIQLAAIDVDVRSHRRHDLNGAVEPVLERLDEVADGLARRSASGFERHLEDRLMNGGTGSPVGLGFSITARLCEMLGAVQLFGRWPAHLGFDDATWQQAGAAGFEIAKGGIDVIIAFLRGLRKPGARDSRDGPHNDWGIVYNWMEDTRDEEIEPLLEPIRDHIEDSYPIAAGKRVLGRYVKERRMHSVWTASVEYGVHAQVLRQQLGAAGLIEDNRATFDNHVLFPARPNRILLERLSRGVSALHARERINCERQVFAPLVQAGVLKPIVEVTSGYPLFDTAELDQFIASLIDRATPYATKPANLETIATARMRCICGQPEIVQLIQAGKLRSVGRLESETGYSSILVDPAEVAPLVKRGELGGMVAADIVADLGVPWSGLVQMLDVQLPTVRRMHPTRRCQQQVVDEAVYADFKAMYVSLRDLSRAAGVNARKYEVILRERGIQAEVGFPPRVHLYMRSKLE